jgi:hypothetical protein
VVDGLVDKLVLLGRDRLANDVFVDEFVRFFSVRVMPLLVQVRTWLSLTNAEPTAVKSLTLMMPRSVLNAARYFTRVAVNSPSTEYSTTVTFPVILVGESDESRAPL